MSIISYSMILTFTFLATLMQKKVCLVLVCKVVMAIETFTFFKKANLRIDGSVIVDHRQILAENQTGFSHTLSLFFATSFFGQGLMYHAGFPQTDVSIVPLLAFSGSKYIWLNGKSELVKSSANDQAFLHALFYFYLRFPES